MGCKKLNTDFFNFLEIVHSEKSDREQKKCINYYPFGLLHKGYNHYIHPYSSIYNYGFNGKELQEDNGIAWLDFGSRNYEAELGRWMNIDPQAGRYHSMSPFAAMGNNPMMFVDPNGEELVSALIAGAFIGAWIGGMTTAVSGGGSFSDYGKNMLIGGLAGMVSAGVGSALTSGTNAVITGTGFYNGAAVGGASGFAGGMVSGSLAPALYGGDFGDIVGGGISGGFMGGISGAVMGGVSGGLNAVGNDREFWSGKKWIRVGSGVKIDYQAYFKKVSEIGRDWENITMPEGKGIPKTNQNKFFDTRLQKFGCSYACKLSVDKYFGLNDPNGINSSWRSEIMNNNRGLSLQGIRNYYESAGYNTYRVNLSGGNKGAVLTMARYMETNKVLQIYHINTEVTGGHHTSLIHRIKYLPDYSRVRITIMDPASGYQTIRIKDIKQIFSIWQK